MKKLLSITALLFIFILAGCAKADSDKLTIGILQPVEHDALNAAKEGFVAGLKENGFDESKVDFIYNNALGSDNDLKSMASSLVRKSDLVLGIGTGATQTIISQAASVNFEKPILFTAVTDPVLAGIVVNDQKPEKNVTGTSDKNPVKEQVELIKEILPDAKKIGVIYTASEQNSEVQANQVREIGANLGLEVVIKTVTSASEIQQVTRDLAREVEAIYIPTDNLIASNMPLVAQIANEEKVLTVAGEEGPVKNGAAITLGISYFELGRLTGQMASEILNGKEISKIPVQTLGLETTTVAINQDTLDAIGIKLPKSILDRLN